MKDLTPKVDTTSGPTGQLIAADYNDARDDAQNAVTNTGQTLTATAGEDNEQFTKAIAVGGRPVTRAGGETAAIGDIVIVDNSGGPITINLPDPTVITIFIHATVDFEPSIDLPYSTSSLTVGRSGQLIMGLAENLVLSSTNADNKKVRFIWKAGSIGWRIITLDEIGTTL